MQIDLIFKFLWTTYWKRFLLWIFYDEMSCRRLMQYTNWKALLFFMFFFPVTPVPSTRETDRHDIAEILFYVALNTINLTLTLYKYIPKKSYNAVPLVTMEQKKSCSWNIKTRYLRFKHFIITITDDPSPY
jgi:hypothetical protein